MKGILLLIGLMALAVVLSGCIGPDSVVCSTDAKLCPNGDYVARDPSRNCQFNPCPARQECDAMNPCSGEKECYAFPGEEKAYCYKGNPCLKCETGKCDILESYPMQIRCEKPCARLGEEFSETVDCCPGLVKAVATCEKCKKEGQPLAFDGIPCCEGLEAVEGLCRKPGQELPCRKEGETIPVITEPPECCEGLTLIPPKEVYILGISGYCTAKCGNGTCDNETESINNCPEDCKVAIEHCAEYIRDNEIVEKCATCGDGNCQAFEECTPSVIICDESGECIGTDDCGLLYCPEDCEEV